MRIILSRKGFDAGSGGVPSPIILPDRKLCYLPIPCEGERIRYSQVSWEGHTLGTIVESLTKGKRLIPADSGVHLDPDIDPQFLPRQPGWRGIFGQTGAAQSHLKNRGVEQGDVFLFYGWYKLAEDVEGGISYVAEARDLHVLFGWLQIDRIVKVDDCPDSEFRWARYHSHFRREPDCRNTVYIARQTLDLPGLQRSIPGSGVFGTFREELCLTAPNFPRSEWRLPGWFYPPGPKLAISYHSNQGRWRQGMNCVYLQTVSRGQEFVLDCDHYSDACGWLKELLDGAS